MIEDRGLDAFQAALLDVLARARSGEEALRELTEHPACVPFRDYVATFEPRMLQVAAELVRKWGVPRRSSRADARAP